MSLFGKSSVQKLKEAHDVDGLYSLFLDTKKIATTEHYKAIEALVEIADEHVIELFISALDHYRLRSLAAGALVRIGAPAVEPLTNVLTNLNHKLLADNGASPGMRWRALSSTYELVIDALKLISDPRAVAALVNCPSDAWKFGDEAVNAMGSRAVSALLTVIDDESSSVNVRKHAAELLGKISDPQTISVLADFVNDKSEKSQTRVSAAVALASSRNTLAVEPLISTLDDEDIQARIAAISALGMIGDTRAIGPLTDLLKDRENEVRGQAAMALKNLFSTRAYEMDRSKNYRETDEVRRAIDSLITALDDDDSLTRNQSAGALGYSHNTRAVEALLTVLNHNDAHMQTWVMKALEDSGDPRAIEPLIGILKDENGQRRNVAADVLGKFDDVRAVEPLLAVLKDEDEILRSCAAHSLGELYRSKKIDSYHKKLIWAHENTYIYTATVYDGDDRWEDIRYLRSYLY